MRIALCISGYFRGFQICFPSWKRYLLNNNHQFDVFVCTGHTKDVYIPDRVEPDIEILRRNFGLVKFHIDTPVTDIPLIYRMRNYNHRNISGMLSMFRKIKIANEMKTAYEKEHGFVYDTVVRWRPDTLLESQVNFECDGQSMFLPKHGDFGGLNDQMAWSTSAIMNHYSSLYDHIFGYMTNDSNLRFDPELLVKTHWEKLNCPIQRPEIMYRLARSTIHILPDNEERALIHQRILSGQPTPPPVPRHRPVSQATAPTIPTPTPNPYQRSRPNPRVPPPPQPAPPPPTAPPPELPPSAPFPLITNPTRPQQSKNNNRANRVVPSTAFPSPIYKKIK